MGDKGCDEAGDIIFEECDTVIGGSEAGLIVRLGSLVGIEDTVETVGKLGYWSPSNVHLDAQLFSSDGLLMGLG